MRWLLTHGPLAWLISAWDAADARAASAIDNAWEQARNDNARAADQSWWKEER